MSKHCSSDKSGCKTKCFKIALLAVVGVAAIGWLVMLLWNWLLPSLFIGAQQIGYWQALGVLLLSKILFGGCHGHGRWHGRRQHWENMTPEEREQIKGRFKSRWSKWCNSDTSTETTVSKPEQGAAPHDE